jgi:hypothetical protein
MTGITVTITTPGSGPFQLSQLLAGATYSGAVTVTPAAAAGPPVTPATPPRIAAECIIEGDDANSTNMIYVGDVNLTPTSNEIGAKVAAGKTVTLHNVPTAGVYINGSSGSPKANILVNGGFQ